ncbi:MAG: threonine--tRNA ligase [bacterium JZ-2024 1]
MQDLEKLRHTASHMLAQAVKRLFPEAKLAIGPPIDNGFYYDFLIPHPFTDEDLARIENEMRIISRSDYPVEQVFLSRKEAYELLKNEPLKRELLEEIPDDPISFYRQGEFIDLCRGPHISSTGQVKFFKILSTAGAYWRGDEHREKLQRIYGTAFFEEQELQNYLHQVEEAKKRDHRKLGKELELFMMFPEEAGPGLVFYLPKGVALRRILEELSIREHLKNGYVQVMTPHILKLGLWETSGHLENYRENMFLIRGGEEEFAVKPMNCPAHILIYKSKRRSYRELPLRLYELGTVYRYERSGTMHGLLRVRGMTQDDAHIFCPVNRLQEEIQNVIQLTVNLLKRFGFHYTFTLKGRPEKSIGSEEIWQKAMNALETALNRLQLPYEFYPADGAFYGPKIDFILRDALGREWQGSTIQVDFNLPQRFHLTFVNENDQEETPVMIHRAIWGTFERFIGILIEHYGGNFPLWLSPIQFRILPISEKYHTYAREIYQDLQEQGFRVELDLRNEKVNYKIREAQMDKIPYMFIVGRKEEHHRTVSVRSRKEGDLGEKNLHAFLQEIQQEWQF